MEPGSFPGTLEAGLAEVMPEDRERVKLTMVRALESGHCQAEYRVRRQDGHIMWVEVRGRVERAADGTPSRISGVCSDVSERKLAEERLQQLFELSTRL